MKKFKIRENLSFIRNDGGIPIYDKTGDKIRDGVNAWQEALDAGINIEPTGEQYIERNSFPDSKKTSPGDEAKDDLHKAKPSPEKQS